MGHMYSSYQHCAGVAYCPPDSVCLSHRIICSFPFHAQTDQSASPLASASWHITVACLHPMCLHCHVLEHAMRLCVLLLYLQVEPPKDPETYIHRSGRTGRAGHTGVCITLVGRKHEDRIPYIEKKAGRVACCTAGACLLLVQTVGW